MAHYSGEIDVFTLSVAAEACSLLAEQTEGINDMEHMKFLSAAKQFTEMVEFVLEDLNEGNNGLDEAS